MSRLLLGAHRDVLDETRLDVLGAELAEAELAKRMGEITMLSFPFSK